MANLLLPWLTDLFLLLGRGTQALCKEQTFAQIYVRSLFKLAGYHLLHRYPYRSGACSPGPVLFCLACLALSLAAGTGNLGFALGHLPSQEVSRRACQLRSISETLAIHTKAEQAQGKDSIPLVGTIN